jgi:mycofactocin system glycosyltransferase
MASQWLGGQAVGARRGEGVLARRLVSSGICRPRPGHPPFTDDDVTVVLPVYDRPEQLRRVLAALGGLRCLVVDDGSSDPHAHRTVAQEAGAALLALPNNQGPAAARNAGLAQATTRLVAFVDSDCLPTPGWLAPLLAHFEDPLVAAVAPRIIPLEVGNGTLRRYEAVRSSLDRGPTAGLVRAHSRISYVPSATLVVRRAVADQPFFDPGLRGGEDVDLVWRLADAGWDVRYEPASTVAHDGPDDMRTFLGRRAFYGMSAGPLARRHPDDLAPAATSLWTAAVLGFTWRRHPVLAAATLAGSVGLLARRLDGLVERPVKVAATIAGGGTARAAAPLLAGLTRAWSPALVLALLHRRTRMGALSALLAPALHDWAGESGGLDPLRYVALHVADDLAYGGGVWWGCWKARTIRPLLPRISVRARIWSRDSLRRHLRPEAST